MDKDKKTIFDYYKLIAEHRAEECPVETEIYVSQIKAMMFQSEKTILGKYLNASPVERTDPETEKTVVFPFGFSMGQRKAVYNTLSNQISFVEFSPYIDREQTILNMVANIVMRGNNVAVISKTKDSSDILYEKFKRSGYEYMSSYVGDNEKNTGKVIFKEMLYPDFSDSVLNGNIKLKAIKELKELETALTEKMEESNSIAALERELTDTEIENRILKVPYKKILRDRSMKNSERVQKIITACDHVIKKNRDPGIVFKARHGIKASQLPNNSGKTLISYLKSSLYKVKIAELTRKIEQLKDGIYEYRIDDKIRSMMQQSEDFFRSELERNQRGKEERPIFTERGLWTSKKEFLEERPVVFGGGECAFYLFKDATYDYVIIDEASQTDIITGLLAMACTNNIVIMGNPALDYGKFSNEDKEIFKKYAEEKEITENYIYETQSFMASASSIFKKAARTGIDKEYYF